MIDEFTRECLAIRVSRKLNATDVIDVLSDADLPSVVCSILDEVVGPDVIGTLGPRSRRHDPSLSQSRPLFGCFCGTLSPSRRQIRDELLNGEIFYSLNEAKIIIEGWRRHYNTIRPHSSLAYRLPGVAGCATRTSFAGHPSPRAQADDELT